MKDTADEEEARWLSDVHDLEEELAICKRKRNYYEGRRKKLKSRLDILLANDPRQTRLEFEDEAVGVHGSG